MIEASIFLPSTKAALSRAHARTSLKLADAIEREINAERPDPGRVAQLTEVLAMALASAPHAKDWSKTWARYCRWQAVLDPILVELVQWLHEHSDEDRDDPRFRAFQLIYAPDPYELIGGIWDPADVELVDESLFARFDDRSSDRRSWQTALGRAVLVEIECGADDAV